MPLIEIPGRQGKGVLDEWRPVESPDASERINAGCVLVRPLHAEFSYAEMVHPADQRRSEILPGDSADGLVTIRHQLFGEPLEKGVIRRARLLALFMPRSGDTARVSEASAAFASSAPPLGA